MPRPRYKIKPCYEASFSPFHNTCFYHRLYNMYLLETMYILAVLKGFSFTMQTISEQTEPLNIERDAVLVRMRQSGLL